MIFFGNVLVVGIQPGFRPFQGQNGQCPTLMAVELATRICKALTWIAILGIVMGKGTHARVLRLNWENLAAEVVRSMPGMLRVLLGPL